MTCPVCIGHRSHTLEDLRKYHRPTVSCPACWPDFRLHSARETARYHPLAGHGYQSGQGWSSPEAEQEHAGDVRREPEVLPR